MVLSSRFRKSYLVEIVCGLNGSLEPGQVVVNVDDVNVDGDADIGPGAPIVIDLCLTLVAYYSGVLKQREFRG